MEWGFIFLTIFVGLATVLQAGINRSIGTAMDLNLAVFLNSAMVLVISGSFYFVARLIPERMSPLFSPQPVDASKLASLGWKIILPGLCGFCIVVGIPWAMTKLGALKVFLFMIGSQLIFSSLWDYVVEGIPFTTKRILGALITLVGASIALL